MMQYSEFEKHARQTFSQDVLPVDVEALLGNLALGSKPKRKIGTPIWLASAIVGLVLLLGTWGYFQFQTSPDLDSNIASAIEMNQSTFEKNHKEEGSTNLNHQELISPINNENQNQENTLSTSTFEQNQSATFTEGSQHNKNINHSTVIHTPITYESRSSNETHTEALENQNKQPTAKVSNSAPLLSELKTIDEKVNAPNPYTESREITDRSHLAIASLSTRSLEDVPSIESPGLNLIDAQVRNLPLGDPIKCPTFKTGSGLHFDLIPEIGYMVPDKFLDDQNNETSLVTSIRKGKEKSIEGLQAALYGRVSKDNLPFYIKAGISYTRVSEKLPLEYDYIESDTTIGIISISSNPAGDTITTVMGEIITETQISGNTTKHYYVHQWDLPIAIGYERPVGGFVLGVEGGLHVNLRTSVTGNILDTQDTFRPAARGTDIKRRVGLGYFGGVSLGKYIPRIGDVYLAARARYIPDVSDDQAATKQSYMMYGLHAGYIYRF